MLNDQSFVRVIKFDMQVLFRFFILNIGNRDLLVKG
jgi:hypothetical protein